MSIFSNLTTTLYKYPFRIFNYYGRITIWIISCIYSFGSQNFRSGATFIMIYIVESLGKKLQPLMSNLYLSSKSRTKLLSFSQGIFNLRSQTTVPRCYRLGFHSWVVATETQGNHFKPTLRLVASPTNLERALSY